jgi:hypothetical protein
VQLERPLNPFVKEHPEPADFTDARLARLLTDWQALAAKAGDTPPVSAIDPTAMRYILGWLMIMEPVDGGADFKYRLYGSDIVQTMQRELTGCRLSDSWPNFANWSAQLYREVMAHKHPVLSRHSPQRYVAVDRWERLILPFADDRGNVTRLLVGAVANRKIPGNEDSGLPWPLRDYGKPG